MCCTSSVSSTVKRRKHLFVEEQREANEIIMYMIGSVHCTFPLVKHCNWLFNSTQSQLFALCRFAVKGFVFFLVKPQCEYTDESQLGPLCMSCSGMYTQQLNYYCKTMLKNSVLELRARSALRACLESRKFWDGVCSTDKSLSEVLILFIELRVQYMKTVSSEHVENMLCAQIVFFFCFDIQNNLCSQHVLNGCALDKQSLRNKSVNKEHCTKK